MVSGSNAGSSHTRPQPRDRTCTRTPWGCTLGPGPRLQSVPQGKATCRSGAGRTEQPPAPVSSARIAQAAGPWKARPDLLCSVNLKDLYPSTGDTEVERWLRRRRNHFSK